MKRVRIMWVEGAPETAVRMRNPLHAWWFAIIHFGHRITTWNGLTSNKRNPIDIARQMDDFMRVRRIRY